MGVFLPILGSLTKSMLSSLLTKSLVIPCMLAVPLHSHLLVPPCNKSRTLVDGPPMPSSFIYEKTPFLFKGLLPGAQLSMPNRMIISSCFTTIHPSASMIMTCMLQSFCRLAHTAIKIGHLGCPHYSILFDLISHCLISIFHSTNHDNMQGAMVACCLVHAVAVLNVPMPMFM